MKRSIKHTYQLFLVFSLTLIMVEFSFIDTASSNDQIPVCIESSENSTNSENTFQDFCGDDVFVSSFIVGLNGNIGGNYFNTILKVNFTTNYNSFIWQPPKFS